MISVLIETGREKEEHLLNGQTMQARSTDAHGGTAVCEKNDRLGGWRYVSRAIYSLPT